jgi:hypothetical protein
VLYGLTLFSRQTPLFLCHTPTLPVAPHTALYNANSHVLGYDGLPLLGHVQAMFPITFSLSEPLEVLGGLCSPRRAHCITTPGRVSTIRLRQASADTHREAVATGPTLDAVMVADDHALDARDPPVHGPVTRDTLSLHEARPVALYLTIMRRVTKSMPPNTMFTMP